MPSDRVEAVERAMEILGAFTDGGDSLGLKDLAAHTGYYKSTILRLCASLERYEYLERDPDGAFRLGPAAGRLGAAYRRAFRLEDLVRPALSRIAEVTGETASLYVRDGDERVCLLRHNSSGEIRHHLEEGARLPLARGAGGRVLLAFEGRRGQVYQRIREQGYYLSLGERSPDVGALAVPLSGNGGELHGALSVSGLVSRFSRTFQQRALDSLRREATAITAHLETGIRR